MVKKVNLRNRQKPKKKPGLKKAIVKNIDKEGWSNFEQAVDIAMKSKPKHKIKDALK
jgi:hypothetical protein